jgi:hypothetical protein
MSSKAICGGCFLLSLPLDVATIPAVFFYRFLLLFIISSVNQELNAKYSSIIFFEDPLYILPVVGLLGRQSISSRHCDMIFFARTRRDFSDMIATSTTSSSTKSTLSCSLYDDLLSPRALVVTIVNQFHDDIWYIGGTDVEVTPMAAKHTVAVAAAASIISVHLHLSSLICLVINR